MSERGRWVYVAGDGEEYAENEARWVWIEYEEEEAEDADPGW